MFSSSACVLLLSIVTRLASSSENDYLENRDIPDNIKLFVASFESRVNEKIDNELRRQLTQIRARIDYRIPSLLDVTLRDKISSGFINKAMDDAVIRRVETLEKEVAMLNEQLEGNMTELTGMKTRLQEAEGKLRNYEETNLMSEVEKLKKSTDEMASAFRILNETFDVIDLDAAKLSEDVNRLNSELFSVGKNGMLTATKLETLQTRVQIINDTVTMTIVNTENLERIEAELTEIRSVYNTTVNLEELESGLGTVSAIVNVTNAAVLDITVNKENIRDLQNELVNLGESLYITNLNLTALVNGLQQTKTALTNASGDLVINSNEIGDLKAEVLQIWNNVGNTSVDIGVASSPFHSLDSTLTRTVSDMNDIREHLEDISADTFSIKQNWTITVKTVEQLGQVILNLDSRVSDNVNVTQAMEKHTMYLMKNSSDLALNLEEIKYQMSDLDARVNQTAIHSKENRHGITTLTSELTAIKQNITKSVPIVIKSALDAQSEVKNIKMIANTTAASINGFEDKLLAIGVKLNSTFSAVTRNTESINSMQSEISFIRSGVETVRSDARNNLANITNIESSLVSISTQLNTVKSGLGSLRKDVKFEVRLSVKSIKVSKGSILKFNKVMYNAGSGYSVTTGQFTATVAGSYLFWASIVIHQRKSTFAVELIRNDVSIANSAGITSTNIYYDTLSMTAVTELNAGDKVWLKKDVGSGTRVYGDLYSGFGGILIK